MNKEDNSRNIWERVGGVVLAVASCVSSLHALTEESWLCLTMIGISVVLTGIAIYWLRKDIHTNRAWIFLAWSAIMIPGSCYKLWEINRNERRAEQWQAYVDSHYEYNGGHYKVNNPPTDGPSQMEVAWKSFQAKDYETAKAYAEKALGQGVCEAATILMDCYYYGLGVEPDMQMVVQYLLTGMQAIILEDPENAIAAIEKKSYVFSERERMLLDRRLRDNDYLLQVIDEISDAATVSRKNVRTVLKRHHARIEDLSISGSVVATLFLYMELIEDEWQGRDLPDDYYERLWKYSDILVSADCLPTDPYSRVQACVIHDGPQDYCASNVDYFIKHNAYPELCLVSTHKNYREPFLKNDLSDANEYLFAKYRLYRAQYEYYKSFMVTDRRINDMMCYQCDNYSITRDLRRAQEMLHDVIMEIFDAMPSLEK